MLLIVVLLFVRNQPQIKVKSRNDEKDLLVLLGSRLLSFLVFFQPCPFPTRHRSKNGPSSEFQEVRRRKVGPHRGQEVRVEEAPRWLRKRRRWSIARRQDRRREDEDHRQEPIQSCRRQGQAGQVGQGDRCQAEAAEDQELEGGKGEDLSFIFHHK